MLTNCWFHIFIYTPELHGIMLGCMLDTALVIRIPLPAYWRRQAIQHLYQARLRSRLLQNQLTAAPYNNEI
jgi:hypothetical protein